MADLPPRRRISGWKIAGIFVGVLAILAVATALSVRSAADRRWAEMERETQALVAEAKGRHASRPVLRGDPVEGNAWDDYAVAMKVTLPTGVTGEYVRRGPKADRTAVEKLLAANAAVVEAFRRGTRRTHGQFPIEWGQPGGKDSPGLGATQGLAHLVVCQARFLAEAGKPREAAELLLDACQFGRDVSHNTVLMGRSIGLSIYGMVFEELHDLIVRGNLKPEDLARISRELETLDRSFPRSDIVMMNESAYVGVTILKSEGDAGDLGFVAAEFVPSLWRFGFSGRLMIADAFATSRSIARRLERIDDMPWPEVEATVGRLKKELEADRNPMVKYMAWSVGSRPGRDRQAQLRLLRAAAHYRATGEGPDLEDPFGGKLRSELKGPALKVWSVGANGTDDRGTGSFKPQKDADVVLEVER